MNPIKNTSGKLCICGVYGKVWRDKRVFDPVGVVSVGAGKQVVFKKDVMGPGVGSWWRFGGQGPVLAESNLE